MTETFLIALFCAGYLCVALEHWLGVNKAGTALLMAVGCWTILQSSSHDHHHLLPHLSEHLADISQIVLFLLGAMAIVELMAEYKAFDVLQRRISEGGIRTVLWGVPPCAFFMSAVLDNVTATILMLSILRPLVPDGRGRARLAAIVVLSANAGGAWSPIGDVTTTMLWIGDRVHAGTLVTDLLLPSLVCAVVPVFFLANRIRRSMEGLHPENQQAEKVPYSGVVLCLGVGSLLFVPVLKLLTGLPPYVGILLGLGVVWVVTDIIDTAAHLKVPHVLGKIDVSSVLFFLGILLAVSALDTAGTLLDLSRGLDVAVGDKTLILTALGLLSAVVDNVPMTAAVMGMYDLSTYPADSSLWHLTAYCADTGGSILVIGSAAGVVAMGMENLGFGWWLKHIAGYALLGYFAGIACFLLLHGPVLDPAPGPWTP